MARPSSAPKPVSYGWLTLVKPCVMAWSPGQACDALGKRVHRLRDELDKGKDAAGKPCEELDESKMIKKAKVFPV